MQVFEVGIVGVQRIGVSAVGVQHQSAVSAGESAWGDGPGGHAISPLHIVGQHIAGQCQLRFRRRAIVVIKGFWHIVGDVDVERAGRGVAIAVAGNHGELFAEIVHAVAGCMSFVAVEGVAVADNASRRVVAGDGQGVAQLRGDRLREADRHTANDNVDAADAQAGQTVRCRHGETAALRQCTGVGRRTVRQIGFIDVEFTARHIQTGEGHRIVHRWRHHHSRGVIAVVDHRVVAFFREFRNTAEPGGGETDDRIDASADFRQQDKTVAAARLARCAARGIRTGRGGFSGFARVVTGGDGFLDLLDVGQLRVARGHCLRGIYMHRLTRQQFTGHGHAAAASEGQFLAVFQLHRHRAFRASNQLITCYQAIPLNQYAFITVG
ncbi:hypothetical protein PS619_04622 [Pseudomonas fluorescens]|nr:hypothetical protein PS619_04622 [Pseudomonas fluorescens]